MLGFPSPDSPGITRPPEPESVFFTLGRAAGFAVLHAGHLCSPSPWPALYRAGIWMPLILSRCLVMRLTTSEGKKRRQPFACLLADRCAPWPRVERNAAQPPTAYDVWQSKILSRGCRAGLIPRACAIVHAVNEFKQRFRLLRSLLRRQGRSREDADDLIQEAFLRLHVYCQDEKVQKQDALLTRIVLNLSVDLHRRERRDLYCEETVESLPLIDLKATPDEELAASQRLIEVGAVLDRVGSRTREIFLMHRLEGCSCSQIATRFGISVSAVEKHIAKAVLALMDVVES
jgi:RNA polymerase sigma factor (sigma-70 family)